MKTTMKKIYIAQQTKMKTKINTTMKKYIYSAQKETKMKLKMKTKTKKYQIYFVSNFNILYTQQMAQPHTSTQS